MTTLPDRPYLKTKEVAAYFGVSTRTVERWGDKGKVLAIKVEGSTRINRESVILLEARGVCKGA